MSVGSVMTVKPLPKKNPKTKPPFPQKADSLFLKIKGCQCTRHLHSRSCRSSMYIELGRTIKSFCGNLKSTSKRISSSSYKVPGKQGWKRRGLTPSYHKGIFLSSQSNLAQVKNLPVLHFPLTVRLQPRSSFLWAITPCFHSNQISRKEDC